MESRAVCLLVLLLVHMSSVSMAAAPDNGSTQEAALKAKSIVEAAHAYVRKHSGDMAAVQHALRTNPDFFDHDHNLYVFIHCYNIKKKEAICCGQGIRPELIGKNMWHLRTPNGRLLFHECAQIIEKEGEGWIEYEWLNPFTGGLQTKRSYLKGIVLQDGRKAWIGCGFWEEK